MEKDLELNLRLYSADGIIGRRDFFLNLLYICMITLPLWFPLAVCLAVPKIFDMDSALIAITILMFFTFVAFLLLLMPNLIKRLNDINGKNDKLFNAIYLICFYATLLLAIGGHSFFYIFVTGFCIHLFSKKGVITGKLPHDMLKEFNNIKNKEILASFYMDESVYTSEKVNFKDILKASFKAYQFYKPSEE